MFHDRYDAASQLVQKLQKYKNKDDVIILAIPRGALQLGSLMSRELHAPLDIVLSKKIGAPGEPEYALGAVSIDDIIIDPEYADDHDMQIYIKKETTRIRGLLVKRLVAYRRNRPLCNVKNKIVIVVDDGIATGKTMMMTLQLIKKQHPKKIVLAVPVAPQEALNRLKGLADEIICLEIPEFFFAIGSFYRSFEQVEDEEAIKLLHESLSCIS